MHHNLFGGRAPPEPAVEDYCAPQIRSPSWIEGGAGGPVRRADRREMEEDREKEDKGRG